MKLAVKQNAVDQKLLVNRFLPLQEQNETNGKVQDNFKLETIVQYQNPQQTRRVETTVQYQNPQQTQRDTNNRQNYQLNVIVNDNQENNIPQWEQKIVPC